MRALDSHNTGMQQNGGCQRRGCDGELREMPEDPSLPDYITLLECQKCREVYELDEVSGEMEVDR